MTELKDSSLRRIAALLETIDLSFDAGRQQVDHLQHAVRAAQNEAAAARYDKRGTVAFWFAVGVVLGALFGASAMVFFTH
jgi:fructose-1,6-bisphosphatase